MTRNFARACESGVPSDRPARIAPMAIEARTIEVVGAHV
jgi:hypothetical protein